MTDLTKHVVEDAPVLFELLPSGNGKYIGMATLNAEKSLNALNLKMVRLLQPQLDAWQRDGSVACVLLQGAGERAFCGGGDVVQLYKGILAGDDGPQTFFTEEYRLDYTIHTYKKPFIVWGNGIVMGGGLGLMSGASHRVVTEKTRMAMPEVSIGLYPDVGGTYFLNRTPGRTGLFLGITGASINANDAIFVGLADRFILQEEHPSVLKALGNINWSDDAASRDGQVNRVLREFANRSIDQLPESQVANNFDYIQKVTDQDSVADIYEAITAYKGEDKWLSSAAKILASGCPDTIFIVYEQLRRGKHLSLKEVFQMELIISTNCTTNGNFQEGVRALLVEKDRNPAFVPATIEGVTAEYIDSLFQAPWGDGVHPLADL